jgi:hypothetical protein
MPVRTLSTNGFRAGEHATITERVECACVVMAKGMLLCNGSLSMLTKSVRKTRRIIEVAMSLWLGATRLVVAIVMIERTRLTQSEL